MERMGNLRQLGFLLLELWQVWQVWWLWLWQVRQGILELFLKSRPRMGSPWMGTRWLGRMGPGELLLIFVLIFVRQVWQVRRTKGISNIP